MFRNVGTMFSGTAWNAVASLPRHRPHAQSRAILWRCLVRGCAGSLNDFAARERVAVNEGSVSTRLRLVVPLYDQRGSRRIVPVCDARSVATAQALDWPGVLFEAGRN